MACSASSRAAIWLSAKRPHTSTSHARSSAGENRLLRLDLTTKPLALLRLVRDAAAVAVSVGRRSAPAIRTLAWAALRRAAVTRRSGFFAIASRTRALSVASLKSFSQPAPAGALVVPALNLPGRVQSVIAEGASFPSDKQPAMHPATPSASNDWDIRFTKINRPKY